MFRLALDSGAHSIYHKHVSTRGSGGFDYTFYRSAEFRTYCDGFVQYVKDNEKHFTFYVTIDAIFNPKITWEVLKYLESCGISPMPVLHYGEEAWAKRYADNYERVGMGGLGQIVTMKRFVTFADKLFKIFCDSKGRPRTKVHGFAISAIPILYRYPWASVDATTSLALARYGSLIVPQATFASGKVSFRYDRTPALIPISPRRSHAPRHHQRNRLGGVKQKVLEEFLKTYDTDFDTVRDDYLLRDFLNVKTMERYVKEVEKKWAEKNGSHELIYYLSGKPSSANKGAMELLRRTVKGSKVLGYLGTYFIPGFTKNVIKAFKEGKKK